MIVSYDNRKVLVIVLGFIVEFLYWGVYCSFTLFYSDLVTDLNSTYSFIGFCATAAASFGFLLSPVAGSLVVATNYGFVFVLMGSLFFISYFASSYDQDSVEFFSTYTIIFGMASGLYSLIYNYFVDNMDGDHDTGITVMTVACGLGMVVFGCVSSYIMLDTNVSWRIVFRYLSVGGALIVFCAFGFHYCDVSKTAPKEIHAPPSDTESVPEPETRASGPSEIDRLIPGDNKPDRSGWELLFSNDTRPARLLVSNCLLLCTAMFPIKLSVTYGLVVDNSDSMYYYMMMATGFGTVCSRISVVALQKLLGTQTNINQILTKVYVIGSILCMLVLAAYKTEEISSAGACMSMFFYCCFEGALFSLFVLRTIEVLGAANHVYNLNLQQFFIGLTQPIGSLFCGLVYDSTGDFRYVFLLVAAVLIIMLLIDEFTFRHTSMSRLAFRIIKAQ